MTNESRIACCNICLLADAMKLCASCPFSPGRLALKPAEVKPVNRTELLKPIKEAVK